MSNPGPKRQRDAGSDSSEVPAAKKARLDKEIAVMFLEAVLGKSDELVRSYLKDYPTLSAKVIGRGLWLAALSKDEHLTKILLPRCNENYKQKALDIANGAVYTLIMTSLTPGVLTPAFKSIKQEPISVPTLAPVSKASDEEDRLYFLRNTC